MADQVKVFAPRQPTPTPGAARSVGRTSGRLPEELLSEQVRRLAVFSAVIGSLWTYALLAEFLLVPIATGAKGIDWTAIVVELRGHPMPQSKLRLFLSPLFFKDKTPHFVIVVNDWMQLSSEMQSKLTGTGPTSTPQKKRDSSILSRLPRNQ